MPTPDAPRLHRAARIEDAAQEFFLRKLGRRPRRPAIVPYAGYGAPGWARVMGRVLLTRADGDADRRPQKLRGWRSFATLPAKGVPVTVEAGDVRTEVHADRSGLIDTVVKADLTPGWCRIRLSTPDADTVEAPIRVIDSAARFGIISDIDDTVMVTALPRPLLAGWNTFVLDEHARAAVPGMAVLYERITNARPGSPVLYLSTGAWNVAPALTRFLSRNLYPAGPLLLTDWGPTQDRWFRSGREHKRATLERLAGEFPDMRWLLVGDDGQHDQEIYREFLHRHPENVAGVAIRRLSPTQAVLAGNLPHAADERPSGSDGSRWICAPDGAQLWKQLREADLV